MMGLWLSCGVAMLGKNQPDDKPDADHYGHQHGSGHTQTPDQEFDFHRDQILQNEKNGKGNQSPG
jgi:hypothetical protein